MVSCLFEGSKVESWTYEIDMVLHLTKTPQSERPEPYPRYDIIDISHHETAHFNFHHLLFYSRFFVFFSPHRLSLSQSSFSCLPFFCPHGFLSLFSSCFSLLPEGRVIAGTCLLFVLSTFFSFFLIRLTMIFKENQVGITFIAKKQDCGAEFLMTYYVDRTKV